MNIERGIKRIGTVIGVQAGIIFGINFYIYASKQLESSKYLKRFTDFPSRWPSEDYFTLLSVLFAFLGFFIGFSMVCLITGVFNWVVKGFKDETKAAK